VKDAARVTPAPASAHSFRAFVLRELEDDVTPEAALKEYDVHNAKLTEQVYQKLKGSGLVFDLFHPMSKVRHYDLRKGKMHQDAAKFVSDLRSGNYAELSLRTPLHKHSGACETAGHLKAPQFAFDADANVLVFRKLKAKESVWDIYDSVCACLGFVAMSAPGRHAAGQQRREVRARFESARQARAAISDLVRKPSGSHPLFAHQAAKLMAMILPPEMSNPDRIVKDVSLSADVIRKLDGLFGIAADTTEAVLSSEAQVEMKLDLQVLYLRRVHFFCFYSSLRCADEFELSERAGAALLRCMPDDGEVAPGGDWSSAHESRIGTFLASDASEHMRPVLPNKEEVLRERNEAMCQERNKKIAEGKFKCVECGKLFKGADYVDKHIRKMHAAIFESARREAYEEDARAAFLADTANALLAE